MAPTNTSTMTISHETPTSEQQDEKADGGVDVQRSHQQQHRAAEVSSGFRVPQLAS
ncbi:hypothetical protein C0J45_16498 [Silurus meridionalis]|nr:hypothetical protein C0J45_16498 [Silurus meridionalis]